MSDNNKRYFNKLAQDWDRIRSSLFSERLREKAYVLAKIQEGKTAADIGVGTGFITEGLIRRGIKVIAIDQSEKMLTEMRRKFSGIEDIEYQKGEVESLSLSDATVDYVFANMCLHHVESPLRAIKEMVRILKPEGKLIITDLDRHNFEFLRVEQHNRWMGFKQDEIGQWFSEAGLHNVRVESVGEDVVPRQVVELNMLK